MYPAGWQALPAATSKVTATGLVQGYDYCYAVRATDRAGNTSAWTPSRCTERALDDRALSASTGWQRVTGSSWWNSTTTTTVGARLTKSGVQLDQVGLLATTCNHCGSVAVYVGATQIGTISLYATATHYQRLLLPPRFSLRTGTVTIKVLSSGKTVQIDGLLSTAPDHGRPRSAVEGSATAWHSPREPGLCRGVRWRQRQTGHARVARHLLPGG